MNRLIDLQPKIAKWTKSISGSDKKDVIEQMRKEASKLANNGNCLILGHQIIRVCSNYDNLIKLLIQVMEKGTFSDMALDMIAFCILRNLIEKQEEYSKIDAEGFVNVNLNYLTNFASLFFKSFNQIDLEPLMTYYLNRIKDGDNYYEIFGLSTVLTCMFGF